MSRARVRVPVGGMVSGAVAGLGVLVLLQQSSVLYPTRVATLVALVLGVLLAFLAVNAVATMRGRERGPAGASADADADWKATHAVVAAGTAAHDEPDTAAPSVRLDPGLEVALVQRTGDWTQIRCSNGWTAWVASGDLQDVGARA